MKLQALSSLIVSYQLDGDVKKIMGNGEARELICTTHGYELRGWGKLLEGRGIVGRGGQRGKNWDDCNSIINKYT